MSRIGGNQHNPGRSPVDDYPTDPAWTEALLDRVKFRGRVWEPAAGAGQMVDVLRGRGYETRATCIQQGQDFLEADEPWDGSVITNPPYRHADAFIEKALGLASEQVAMLLPVGALGGQKRAARLWRVRPPALVLMVPQRMKVYGLPSQFCHVWAVWDPQHFGPTEFGWSS